MGFAQKNINYPIFLLLFVLLFQCSKKEPKAPQKITVPQLTGMTIDSARIIYPKIKISVRSEIEDPAYKRDLIINQEPRAGTQISSNDFVQVDVSLGWPPSAGNLRFSGKVDSAQLGENRIVLFFTGSVQNTGSTPAFLNYFYYIAYDDKGARYREGKLNINDWIPPKSKQTKSIQYTLSAEDLRLNENIFNQNLTLVLRLVGGCRYETTAGVRSTPLVDIGTKRIYIASNKIMSIE